MSRVNPSVASAVRLAIVPIMPSPRAMITISP